MKPLPPLVFGCIPPCLLVYIAYRNYPWWSDPVEKYMLPVLAVIICGVVVFLAVMAGVGISWYIGSHAPQVWSEYWRGEMVSMRSADGPNGKIGGGVFMVVGSIGTSETYFYYTQAKDGGLKPHQWVPDSDITIYEEDRQNGTVVQFDAHFESKWVEWFGITNDRLRMDFHIPRGSVHRTFSLK